MQQLSSFACVNALALILLTGCANDDGQVDEPRISGVYDKDANWSSYHSFDVVEPGAVPHDKHPPRGYQESNRVAVVESIIMQMESRGYVRDIKKPDLLLTPMVRLQDVDVAVPAPWYDYYYGWYWGYGYPWYAEDVITLQAGTLIIDAVDVGEAGTTDDDKLVFRGYATSILPTESIDISDEIRKVVASIFDYWPPEQEKT